MSLPSEQVIQEVRDELLRQETQGGSVDYDAAHPHAAGAHGGNQGLGRTKGGSTPRYLWPWMRMVCRSECLLQQVPSQIAQRLVASSKD